MSKKYLVAAGLEFVNPENYNGWDGSCPGCMLDAKRVFSLCRRLKFHDLKLLVNNTATIGSFTEDLAEVALGAKADDLVFIYVSGHGGQIKDESGDEVDGMDETLCLFDGQMSDDYLGSILCKFRDGVRIFFVTDTCNSGTNFRETPRSRPMDFRRKQKQWGMGAELIHFGGCEDGKYSYGAADGGIFTNALLQCFRIAEHEGEPLSLFDLYGKARAMMPRKQVPVYAEYGASPEFVEMNVMGGKA